MAQQPPPEREEFFRELVERIRGLERELDRTRRLVEAVLRVAIPVGLLGFLLLYVYLRQRDDWQAVYGLMLLFAFTPAGKFTAGVFIGRGFTVPETVFILGSIDVVVGLFLVWNFPLVYRVPRIGTALARWEARGAALLLRRPGLRRAAFFGLALLVAIPIQGTGAVVGSLVGRLLGMGAVRTVAAIAVGGYGGVAIVALAAQGLASVGSEQLVLVVFIVLVVTVAAAAAVSWWRRREEQREQRQAP